MIGKRHEIVRFQSDFYRDYYRKVMTALVVNVVLILLLISGVMYFSLNMPTPNYYATTTTGQIIPLFPRP